MVSPARKRLASRSPVGSRHGAKSQRVERSSEPEEGEVSMDEEDIGKKSEPSKGMSGLNGLGKVPLVIAPISLPAKPSMATTVAAAAAAGKKNVPFPFKKGKKDGAAAGSGPANEEGVSSSNVFEKYEARAAKENHKKAAMDHWEPSSRNDRDRSRERERTRRSRTPGSPSTSSSYRSARHRLPAPRSPDPSSSSTFSPRDWDRDRDRDCDWNLRDRDRDRWNDYRREDSSRHYRPEHDHRRDDREWTRRDRDESYNNSSHYGHNHHNHHRSNHDHFRPRSPSPPLPSLPPLHDSLPPRPLTRQPSLPPQAATLSDGDRDSHRDRGTGPRPPSATPPPAPPPDLRLANPPTSILSPPHNYGTSYSSHPPPGLAPHLAPQLPDHHSVSIKLPAKKPDAPSNVHSPVSLGLDGSTRVSTSRAMEMGENMIEQPKPGENVGFVSKHPPTHHAPHRFPAQPPPHSQAPLQDASRSSGSAGPSKPPPGADPLPVVVSKLRQPPKVDRTRKEEMLAYGKTFNGCGQQGDYETMTKLGEGTFGEVHKAIHKQNGHIVALKRILMHNEKEGMPVTALREIKILKALKHSCIVEILDMFVVKSTEEHPLSVYMVFPYMDHDLAGLLENERVKLQPSHIKLYMKQLLEGTEYMHRNHILHRDMKAANLLISNNGSLKIADFGLARSFDFSVALCGPAGLGGNGGDGAPSNGDAKSSSSQNPSTKQSKKYTNCVVTRWYRPPELLLGARHYGGEVDIWGIGCVLGEMFTRKPILPGTSDFDQLEKIFSLCGSPNQHNWPDFDLLPGCDGVIRFNQQSRRLRTTFEAMGLATETVDLMERMLVLNPRDRITAREALGHEYFWTDPMPADPRSMPSYEASHEFDKRGHRHPPPNPPHQPPPNLHQPPHGQQQRPGIPPPGTNPHFNIRGGGGGPPGRDGRRGPPNGLPNGFGPPPGPNPMPGYGHPGGYGPSSNLNPPPIHLGMGPSIPMPPVNLPGMNLQLPPHPIPSGIAGPGGYVNKRLPGPPQGNPYVSGPPMPYPSTGHGPRGLPPTHGPGRFPPGPQDQGPPMRGGRGGHGVNNWNRREGAGGSDRRWDSQRGRERDAGYGNHDRERDRPDNSRINQPNPNLARHPTGLPSKPMAPMGAGIRGEKRDGKDRERDVQPSDSGRERDKDEKEEGETLNYG
ncbi:hypothetical protein CPB83DRAFT_856083 [Crepidotus variabilis]|uniref:Protein kinase domain-containing protein n=1 Tax=Crepidotus variabilis TaxID=179855 RepID=A0A9P6EDF2_9AGAR|nr:hypothetical protein CPB83DRAFT_856083 [Crepidotus variabilis]